MAQRGRSRRTVITVVILVLASLSIITINARGGSKFTSGVRSVAHDVFAPVIGAVHTITQPVANFFEGSFNYGAVTEENARLRRTLSELEANQSTNALARLELAQILALNHLSFVGALPTTMAQVTAVDTSNYASTITIDKGRSQGILLGMPVVASGGLVGQVIATSHSTATIALLDDGSSSIAAVVGAGVSAGTVQGQGAGKPLVMNFVAPGSAVQRGAPVLTSGLEGASFPAGLPIGTISSANSPNGASQMSITVAPAASLDSLYFVDVIQWAPRR